MTEQLTRRRLLASVGGLAGLALGGTAGAVPSRADSADELPVRWSRTYAPNTLNSAVTALERDGQYVALGATGPGADETTGWLFGVDATSGEGQWQTRVENPDLDRQPSFQRLVEAPDGDGFALVGIQLAEGTAALVRTGPEGEVDWWESYRAATDTEEGTLFSSSLVPLEEGYVLGGYSIAGQTIDAVAIRVGADGTEQSRTTLFDDEQSTMLHAVPDGEGGLVGVGQLQERTTATDERPQVRGVVFRLAADLTVQWSREFTPPADGGEFRTTQLAAVTKTADGYTAVGRAVSQSAESSFGWVLVVDGSGSGRVNRLLEPSQFTSLVGVTEAADGLTVVGRLRESVTAQSATGWVAELDENGEGRWSKEFSRAAVNNLTDVVATSDDGVAAVGTVQAESRDADPRTQGWIVKLGGEPAPSVTSTPDGDTSTPTPTPTDTPEPTVTRTPTPTPMTTPTRTPPATETATDTTSGSGPGFGVVGTLATLGIGALSRRISRGE
jgi:hypothetical protein